MPEVETVRVAVNRHKDNTVQTIQNNTKQKKNNMKQHDTILQSPNFKL